MFDMMPFVGIQIFFWVLSVLFNQVLTLHGLIAGMRAVGTARLGALVGALVGGIAGVTFALVGLGLSPASWVFWLISIGGGTVGTLTGYSPYGFARWLWTRPRDSLLFAPRYLMEGLAVILGLPGLGLIFNTSGGNDEFTTLKGVDRYLEMRQKGEIGYSWVISSVSTTLAVGGLVSAVMFGALGISADFSNILLLGLPIFFVLSTVIGFFTQDSLPGQPLQIKFSNYIFRLGRAFPSFLGLTWGALASIAMHLSLDPTVDPNVAFWARPLAFIGFALPIATRLYRRMSEQPKPLSASDFDLESVKKQLRRPGEPNDHVLNKLQLTRETLQSLTMNQLMPVFQEIVLDKDFYNWSRFVLNPVELDYTGRHLLNRLIDTKVKQENPLRDEEFPTLNRYLLKAFYPKQSSQHWSYYMSQWRRSALEALIFFLPLGLVQIPEIIPA